MWHVEWVDQRQYIYIQKNKNKKPKHAHYMLCEVTYMLVLNIIELSSYRINKFVQSKLYQNLLGWYPLDCSFGEISLVCCPIAGTLLASISLVCCHLTGVLLARVSLVSDPLASDPLAVRFTDEFVCEEASD